VAGHTETVRKAFLVKDAADLVGLVTIDATRYLVWLLLPEFTPDDLKMDLLDLCVALHAGVGYVVSMDRRCWVLMRKDIV
jgi:hypothetical protein